MNRLTINRLALAGLRANRKEYRQMAVGVFLAVFLAVGTALGIWTIWEKRTEVRQVHFGQADGFFYRVQVLEPETLLDTGMVSRVGTVSVLGTSGDFRFGFFDEEAESILHCQFLSGGMPQAPNEIALNEKARDTLCPDATPGDTVTLRLEPLAASSYSRDFVLSGVFRSEAYSAVSDWDTLSLLTESLRCFPDILVFRDTPDFQDCMREREYVFTLSPHSSVEALFTRLPYANLVGIDFLGTPFRPGDGNGGVTAKKLLSLEYISPVLAAGGALLLAAMIGIFDAASGQFVRKEKQYRLLRDLGATRAQIWAVSRREAILLALVLSPGAALCAVGFVKLCCRLLPEAATCSIPPKLVLGSILAAFLLVWISASLPALWSLRGSVPGAPKVQKCRSRKQFLPSRLLALRNLRQHPFRFIGSVILVVLLNVTATLLCVDSRNKLENLTNMPSTLRSLRKNFALYTLFLGSLALAFLASTVTLLRGSRARDMQAKADTIRILWSLGYEEKDQAAIWRRETVYIFLAGFLVSIWAELLLIGRTSFWGLKDYLIFSGISSVLGAALCLVGFRGSLPLRGR